MKIWIDENIPQGREAFSAHGETVSFAGRSLARKDIAEADALIVRSITKVNASLLEGTSVRFVGTATIGTDHIDQGYLRERGIGFASAPGCNANSVGEYVTAALTHLEVRKGFLLGGKTLGIIGYGHVGKQVERKALALGMRVLIADPPLREAAQAAGGDVSAFTELPGLLEQSDILSLHVPLTVDGPCPTLRLADADFFARLGQPAVLMNTCRGEVIEDAALANALDAGKILHLILDVFSGEPRIDPGICARADLITPHIAGYSIQGKLNGTAQVAQSFRRFFGFATAWSPDYPAPPRREIRHADAESDPAFLQHCVAHAYDILADDARLRESLRETDAGRAFDRLRRDYPIRHEFSSFLVTRIPPKKRELRTRLLDLGFRVDRS